MTEAISAAHTAEAGYTRSYLRYNRETSELKPVRVTLGQDDVVALILDPDDGSILDYATTDTPMETAVTMAGWGEAVVLDAVIGDGGPADMILNESRLRADCFATTLSERWPSL